MCSGAALLHAKPYDGAVVCQGMHSSAMQKTSKTCENEQPGGRRDTEAALT